LRVAGSFISLTSGSRPGRVHARRQEWGYMTDSDFITVDGRRFHHVWLRDNCPCAVCRDPSSYQKIHDPCERAAIPAAIELGPDRLEVTWSDDPRPHSIRRAWLIANAYDCAAPAAAEERVAWDAGTLAGSPPAVHDAEAGGWTDDLARWGFVRLSGLPRSALEPFVASI